MSAVAYGCSQRDCLDKSYLHGSEESSALAANLKGFGEYLQVDVNVEDGNPYLHVLVLPSIDSKKMQGGLFSFQHTLLN